MEREGTKDRGSAQRDRDKKVWEREREEEKEREREREYIVASYVITSIY